MFHSAILGNRYMVRDSASGIDLRNLTPQAIERFVSAELGQKHGRGMAIAKDVFKAGISDINSMKDINLGLKEGLKARCRVSSITVERFERSEDGTLKLLYGLEDGNTVEGVLIPGPRERLTLCISSQVGCASGCRFCLTASGGLVRNLTTAEMVNQVLAGQKTAGDRRITNLVLMGMGEPLLNYEAVKDFVEIATDPNGMGYPPKRVTISTCGIAPMIEQLAKDGVRASLAVSLNATTDSVRNSLMPINRTWPIDRLIQAIANYCSRSGKSVTIEYVLFKDLNESVDDAKRLADMISDIPCMVNILLFNPFPGCSLERPDDERASVFRDILINRDIIAVIRKSRGMDISAACGQLKAGRSSSCPC